MGTMTLEQFGQTIKAKHPEYADMPDADVGQKVLAKFPQYRDMVQTGEAEPSFMQRAGAVAADVGAGALKGFGQNAATVSGLLNKIPGIGETLAPSAGVQAFKQMTTPTNTAQKIGAGIEQAGELMLPAGAIGKGVKAASALGTGARIAARVALEAANTGANAALHGESPTAGAAAGALGGVVGEGLQVLAPKIAESALAIRARDRLHGKTPGTAILSETSGVRPSTIAQQAGAKSSALTGELESAAANSTVQATQNPALQVLANAEQIARKRNSGAMLKKIGELRDQLTVDVTTGQPLPNPTTPEQILNLKRGIGELANSWSIEEKKANQALIQRVYGSLDKELDRTVIGADELNQRISSLISVQKRAVAVDTHAGITQRVAHRVAAHTGALAASAAGGAYGYQQGGKEGAALGAATGLLAPEILASPTVQMSLARSFASSGLQNRLIPVGKGMFLQIMGQDENGHILTKPISKDE